MIESTPTMTLLLVDDDCKKLRLLALALKSSGFSVLTAGSPVEAMAIMEQRAVHDVDVAILDYHMPGMNGCVLADHLRARAPGLKTILHSGDDNIPEREMSGVDGFILKGGGVKPLMVKISELTAVSREKAVSHCTAAL
jgi:CheY-like chemotaxis protein